MNAYNLALNGSWFLVILFILLSLGLAIWTYTRTIPPISNKKRILLISLRSIAIALLLFILFEPVFTSIQSLIESPRFAVLFDNSASAQASDAAGDRRPIYRNVTENLDFSKAGDKARIFSFDSEVRNINNFTFDSLDFSGQATDISRAIRRINSISEDNNIRSILMITDGAFNQGNNPLFDAERMGKPFFIVGIGDTTDPLDISIQSIITNEIAYIENVVPITVNFTSVGFDAETLKLELFDNNQKIAERAIYIESGRNRYSEVFEYLPLTEGIRKITASILPRENEITDKNNSASEFIKVVKNKRKIAIFAGSPSPDVSFIKQAFMEEKGVEIAEFIQKQGPEFYTTPTQADLNTAELIILIGFPIASTPNNTLTMIARELEHGKPLLFIASRSLDYNKLKELQNYLPFVIVSSRPQEFLVVPDIKSNALSSPLLRITGGDEDLNLWNTLPPIYRTETFVRVKPESEVVSTMKINNAPLNDPLIITRHFRNSKSIAFLGYGLYRWKLLGYAPEVSKGRESVDLFSTLLNNSFRWLSIADDNKLVRVRTTRRSYSQTEQVEFIGEVYDASYTPIENANVLVKISGGGDTREVILNSLGNGRYNGMVAGLPEGDYAFSAAAEFSSRSLGSYDGRFSIGEISLEYQNLKMNAALLRSIAARTGGKFFLANDVNSLMEDLTNHKSFIERGITRRSEIALWNLPYLLAAAILLFSIEWLIRKWSSMI